MTIILLTAGVVLLITMALILVRAALGPTVYDRILAANAFSTKIVVLAAVIAMASGRSDFVDVALLYALANFIALVAVQRFLTPAQANPTEANHDAD